MQSWKSDLGISYSSAVISNCPPFFASSILDTFQSGGLIFQCHIFPFSYCSWGFSQQEYWSDLPFPPPMDHILSELSTMTHPSWVALQGMAHSFMELYKPLYHKAVIHEGILLQLSYFIICYCCYHSVPNLQIFYHK